MSLMHRQFWLGAAFGLLACFPASAGEWAVSCGDNLYCIARIDWVEAKGGAVKFKIERSNLVDGKVYVTFGPSEALAVEMPVRIETLGTGFSHEGPVDKVYGGNEMTFAEAARGPIVEALRSATHAQISVRFGGTIGTVVHDVSLSGLTAALLEIDTKQGRIGRTDAMVAWGSDAPALAIAAKPPAEVQAGVATTQAPEPKAVEPVAVADAASDEAPVGSGEIIYTAADLPIAIAAYGKKFGCALDDTLPAWGANALGMGGGLVLYTVPCQNGDVNIESYVGSMQGGTAKLYQFENQPGFEPVWRDTVINPRFDATTGMVSTIAYDSPGNDCGRFELHRFLGQNDGFELIAVRIKSECDGVVISPEEWPVEWTIDEMGG